LTSPYLHLLRGDDAYSISQQIKLIAASLGADFDPAMNTTRLDGKTASLEEIQTAVSTLPFFGSSRLVIIDSVLSKMEKTRQEKYAAILSAVPPSTHLILIVEDRQKWKKEGGSWTQGWETLTPSHWLMKVINTHPAAEIIDLPLPDEKAMGAWIVTEAKRQGGSIHPDAAQELSRHIGNDTSIASQEIAKLLMYVDFNRQVTAADVLELVSDEGSTDVFKMLDRLMSGETREAQAMMRRLLDDSLPEVILGAVIHRFRQLIQVREALDAGEEIKSLADKRVLFHNQIKDYTIAARRFSMTELEKIYRRLLEMDLQAKTSSVDLATNLELLIVETGK
jgi:DNA polymerase-3 subunit delta